jgi:hypothetical protein
MLLHAECYVWYQSRRAAGAFFLDAWMTNGLAGWHPKQTQLPFTQRYDKNTVKTAKKHWSSVLTKTREIAISTHYPFSKFSVCNCDTSAFYLTRNPQFYNLPGEKNGYNPCIILCKLQAWQQGQRSAAQEWRNIVKTMLFLCLNWLDGGKAPHILTLIELLVPTG